jgi:hypothetical protein
MTTRPSRMSGRSFSRTDAHRLRVGSCPNASTISATVAPSSPAWFWASAFRSSAMSSVGFMA